MNFKAIMAAENYHFIGKVSDFDTYIHGAFHMAEKNIAYMHEIFPQTMLFLWDISYEKNTQKDDLCHLYHENLIVDHPFIVFFYCLEGITKVQYGNEKFTLSKGDFRWEYRLQKERTSYFPTGEIRLLSVVMNPLGMKKSDFDFFKKFDIDFYKLWDEIVSKQHEQIYQHESLARLFRSFYNDGFFHLSLYKTRFIELLLFLSERQNAGAKSYLKQKEIEEMKIIHDYLLAHPEENMSIVSLSRRFALSPTTLKSTFRKVYGLPIKTYVRQAKMQMAMQALVTTEQSIADIGLSLGYENASYFAKVFQEYAGTTPLKYRHIRRKP